LCHIPKIPALERLRQEYLKLEEYLQPGAWPTQQVPVSKSERKKRERKMYTYRFI
jgi:hypothetical protein